MSEPSIEGAAAWLSRQLPAMQEAIAALVEVNSFTENVAGGNRVGELLVPLFTAAGLEARSRPSERYADHRVFTSAGRSDAGPIALIGHLDTVFPPGTFEGYRRDGELARGPGVLDMKGGLVVVAFAVRALAEHVGLHAVPPLRVVIVSDEEIGSPEGYQVIQDEIAGATACLVFEAGRQGDAIITRRKGTGAITARAFGKAAHAGANHREGANALWALSRLVDRVQSLTDYDRGITTNVGKVTGGQGKNTVPDLAEALVDIRFVTRADGEWLQDQVRRVAAEAAASVPGTRIEVHGGIARLPLERTEASAALMHAYGACARTYGLGDAESALVGGGSDASTSSTMDIPSIDGLGPRGTGFHTHDERIDLASLVPKAQALARFLATWRG